MVIYDFECTRGHTFEGWFASRDVCREQEAQGMVRCPVCDSAEVARALSAPAVHLPGRSDDAASKRPLAPEQLRERLRPAPCDAGAGAAKQSALRAMTEAVREVIERHCEDVGARFAHEAEAMYLGDKKPRHIVGTTTPREEQHLSELGVPFARVQLPRFDD